VIRKIRRTKQLRRDIIAIYSYIHHRNPDAAERVFDAIESSIKGLARFRGIGRVWNSTDLRLTGMRIVPVAPYRNYLIFFRAVKNRVEVYRVIHGARELERIVEEITFDFE
jgi:toxin ParE1/3/4